MTAHFFAVKIKMGQNKVPFFLKSFFEKELVNNIYRVINMKEFFFWIVKKENQNGIK